jgi:fucose 4-O-acetylase-like acetyltransferase
VLIGLSRIASTRNLLRLIASAWLLVALRRLPWSYYVASRMWHGQPFAVGAGGRAVGFLTVLGGLVAAVLVWKAREGSGSVVLLLVALGWMLWELNLIWYLADIRLLQFEHIAYLTLSVLTVLVIGLHAVVRVFRDEPPRSGA